MNTDIYKEMYVPMEAALCQDHPLFVLVLNFDLLMYNYSKPL
jgi:hypothetical protein